MPVFRPAVAGFDRRDRLFDLLAIAACIVALTIALQQVRGLDWPYDGDHYRDVAQAQTARDGHPLADPHYRGEWIWYNPLTPWIVAAGSAIAKVSISRFHVQAGPWLNLIAPLGFYFAGVVLVGRRAAFAALVVFLFFNGRTEPALTTPTYSPWLFVATFAQGFFYIAIAVLVWAARTQTVMRGIVLGVLAGLTFLTHTAPAIVLGGCAACLLSPRVLVAAGIAALIVASPFLYAIGWHYHFHVVNDTPMAWQWLPITIHGMPGTLRADAVLLLAGVAGLAIVQPRALIVWLSAATVLLLLALARDLWPALPALVPAFHFWRYVLAAIILLAGVTVSWLCERVAGRYGGALLAAIAIFAVIVALPQYRTRFDMVYGRSIALDRDPNHDRLTAFLHKSTRSESVILGNRGASLQIIGPAGRKVVAVNGNWSNPYVDNRTRIRDRDAMLDALRDNATDRFASLADTYGVSYIVGINGDECSWMTRAGLEPLATIGATCVFAR